MYVELVLFESIAFIIYLILALINFKQKTKLIYVIIVIIYLIYPLIINLIN